MGDTQIGSESPVPGEAKKVSTAIRSRWGQIHQDWVRPRWGPESPGPGEAEVVTRAPGVGEDQVRTSFTRCKTPTWGPESPGMGEAQVATPLTKSR